MALSLISLVPGLLFSTNPTLVAPATRTTRFPALRTPDFASLQKNDENHRVNDFLAPLVEAPGGRTTLGVGQNLFKTTQGDFVNGQNARPTSGDPLTDLFLESMAGEAWGITTVLPH
jgi:hypothetical protein